FSVQINSSDKRDKALQLSHEIARFLGNAELKRADGSVARIENSIGGSEDLYARNDNSPYVSTTATFKDTDTSTLVILAKEAVEREFDSERLSEFGLSVDDL